ncbi:MAG: tetratricopeptide repeat protein [Pseudomonadota bacterium]|nr:tetratricopeptide repeat protein [Pseudomonadota bacterium]
MHKFALVVVSSLAILAVPVAALAAGSGNSGNSGASKPCPTGYEWSKKKKKCVQRQSRNSPQQQLIDQAWTLARNGQFEEGRKLFRSVANQSNPEVLNGLGYTNRKLGFFDSAIGYYKQAVTLDPDYVQAREYLGEGYATLGKLDLAREQLGEIEQRCGTGCEEYIDLKDAIDTAVKTSAQ